MNYKCLGKVSIASFEEDLQEYVVQVVGERKVVFVCIQEDSVTIYFPENQPFEINEVLIMAAIVNFVSRQHGN